jgi:hypothetical protein
LIGGSVYAPLQLIGIRFPSVSRKVYSLLDAINITLAVRLHQIRRPRCIFPRISYAADQLQLAIGRFYSLLKTCLLHTAQAL